MGKLSALEELATRFAQLLTAAPRDAAGGIKVLGKGSDPIIDNLLANAHAPMGNNLFFGGPRGVDPVNKQMFLATKPSHAMYYADLKPEGRASLSVFNGDLSALPNIDNFAPDTNNLIETLLGYSNAKVQKPSTWGQLTPAERQTLESINDLGGAKLLNIDDYTLTGRRYTDNEHEAPQYFLLPKTAKKLEKRAKGGLVQMKERK